MTGLTVFLAGVTSAGTMAFGPQLDEAMRRGYVAAFRILRDPDEANDACQEAAARTLAAKDRYDPSRPLYPWFYRILKNHCFDRLARRKKASPAGDSISTVVDEGAQSAEGRLLDDERSQAVSRAIAALPDDLREIIELRHFQDLSYEAIAGVLECPAGTVMSRLYRARKQLRAQLAQDEDSEYRRQR